MKLFVREGKVYNHPDLKYIINQLKKGTPYTEIATKVNKRAKGEELSRHAISRFAKSYGDSIKGSTENTIKKIHELKQAEVVEENLIQGDIYMETELMPAHETLNLLFDNAVSKTYMILEEVMAKERSMKDFKTFIDAIAAIKEIKDDLERQSPAALLGTNDYENYILNADYEIDDEQAGERS